MITNLGDAQEQMRNRLERRADKSIVQQVVAQGGATCGFCGNPSSVSRHDGHALPCKPCAFKDANLRKLYDKFSLEKFHEIVAKQRGRCADCGVERGTRLVARCRRYNFNDPWTRHYQQRRRRGSMRMIGEVQELVCRRCISLTTASTSQPKTTY